MLGELIKPPTQFRDSVMRRIFPRFREFPCADVLRQPGPAMLVWQELQSRKVPPLN
jgi:hypothetical protein